MTSSPVMGSAIAGNFGIQQGTRNTNSTGAADFKNFMSQSQSKLDLISNNVSKKNISKESSGYEKKFSEIKDTANVNKDDKVMATDTNNSGNFKEVTKEDVDAVKDAIKEVKDMLKEEFDVTDEDIELILETLGLTQMALLDADVLPSIVAKIEGAEDTLSIVTDAEVYASLNAVTDVVNKTVNSVSESLAVSEEEFNETVKQFEEAVNSGIKKDGNVNEMTQHNQSEEVDEDAEKENTFESKITVIGKDLRKESNISFETKVQTVETETAPISTDLRKSAGNEQHSLNETPMNFVQNLMERVAEALSDETSEVSYTTFDARNIMNQITDSIKIDFSMDNPEISLKLHPETLGTVSVKVSTNNEGLLTAQFITQNESVKAIIESQAVVLKENLESKGVTVEAVEVLVQSHEFERNLNDQNRGQNNTEDRGFRRRTRRINLIDEEPSEISEEDNLVKEMMVQNGNTVDYSA